MVNETSNNFFIILDLDLNAPWNQEQFERRLREKQNQWSRESTGFTKKALLAKKRLELISEIKRVMNDPAQREAQARAAKIELSSRQSTREEAFTRRLQMIESKGFLEQSEVDGLIAEFQDVLDEKAIRARITVEVSSPGAEQDEIQHRLEPMVLADINKHLALVEKKDLYHLLSMPPTAALVELYQAADQLYNEMLRRQPKTSVVSTMTVLAAHAKRIFKTAEMRHCYDTSIRYQSLEALLQELNAALKHSTEKRVYPQQVEDFMEKAAGSGWEPEIARQHLQNYALQHGWTLQRSSHEPQPKPWIQEKQQTNEHKHQLPEKTVPQPPPEVQNLRFQNTNAGLRLTWLWPANCNEAHLFYNTTHWPQPNTEKRLFIKITRAEYEALGHYLLRGTTHQNYYIVVSLLVRHEDQLLLTPGTRLSVPLAQKIEITYEIKNPRFGYKHRTLHIYTRTPGTLPTLLLIIRQGEQPLHKSEGPILHREPGPVDLQYEYIISLPNTPFPAQTFGRLFLEDDQLHAVVVIHHPHERKLRLG